MSSAFDARRRLMLATIAAAGLVAAGAGPVLADGQEPALTVTGELGYLPRIALPPAAIAVVEIRREDAPDNAAVVAGMRIELGGRQVPVPFELEVPRAHLEPGHGYVLDGSILVDGRVAWRAAPVALDTGAAAANVGTLMMSQPEPAQEEAGEPQAIAGEWRIARIGGQALDADAGATIAFDADGGFSGRLCNAYRGSYKLDGETIAFGQTAATLMACPEPLASQERELFAAFESAASYRVSGNGTLALLDGDGMTLMTAQRQATAAH